MPFARFWGSTIGKKTVMAVTGMVLVGYILAHVTRFEPQISSAASRTMRWGVVALLLFVVYHILHFTTGHAHPDFRHLAPYHNVTTAFRVWWVTAIDVQVAAAQRCWN